MQEFIRTWGALIGWTLTTVMQALLAIAHWKESRDRAELNIVSTVDKDSAVWSEKFGTAEARLEQLDQEVRHLRERTHKLNDDVQRAVVIADQSLREHERYERLVETQAKRLDDLYREIKRFNGRFPGEP